MALRYIERSLEPVLEKAASEFPAVVLTGPRQSGKTTVLQHLFRNRNYVSLEPPDVRAAALEDPRGFIDAFPPPVIFDEVQYAPVLLPYVKEKIDANRHEAGQYILTGSQNLLLLDKVTESLAGRAAVLRLLPMSRREAEGRPQAMLPWESAEEGIRRKGTSTRQLWPDFLRGYYPELVANPGRDASLWHAGYVQTYLERDVRRIRQVGDLSQFQSFLTALAARSAQLLNLSDLAKDLGVALNTVKAWLSVLEASYQIIVLRPYFVNIGKRLVKTPKVYFIDTGTLCYLTGLKDPEHAASGPLGGAIMETAVLTEIIKVLTHQGLEPRVYFWRTSTGSEVDILVEVARELVPIEVKLSATPRPAMASVIRTFQADFGDRALPGYVVHPGEVRLPLGPGATALPFSEL
ncbi:MAG: ATP-binding protein [Actinobacteria bacterium]|nr:ATP-binding protein [Actinomycetota bacterium]MCG2817746.1 ATP-binding protein [Actinomycetes bacterium]MBU4360015.1 ATP-binding protein [Actinomycetota bacterium]MBU4390962.1 ATP-binding protein [Actinomycetota bacterium]MBU4403388.1 ATP-binding protein [Actinomycetota bacterium]